jgi:hypothetical protein
MATEVLKQLLESEVLTDETRASIKEAFDAVINEAREQARTEVESELTAKFADEFVKDRDALIESVDALIAKQVDQHIEQSKAEIESFRNLEAESAASIVEAREALVEQSKADLKVLIEKVDAFLDRVIEEEFEEIKEDLVEAQRLGLGQKIFEGFRKEFEQLYLHETGISAQFAKMQKQLKESQQRARELQESLQEVTRENTMAKVLSSLEGKPRQVMETILSSVATNKLQETYEKFIDRVLMENAEKSAKVGDNSEKEKEVLAESKVDPKTVSLKTGDEPETKKGVRVMENAKLSEDDKRQLLRSAGLI